MTAAQDPFFIFYDSRSGSTFLARQLSDRLGVIIPPEAGFLPELLSRKLGWWPPRRHRRALRILQKDEKFNDWSVPPARLLDALRHNRAYSRRAIAETVIRAFIQPPRPNFPLNHFGFKKGEYQYHDKAILSIFPNSHFICIVRDGRAVFNSKRKTTTSRGRQRIVDPEPNAREWMRCLDNFERLHSERPGHVLIIYYEKLIHETESVVSAIAERLGIPLGAAKAANYQVPDRYATMHDNVSRPPMEERIDSWRTELPADDIARYEKIAGAHLERHGYAPAGSSI